MKQIFWLAVPRPTRISGSNLPLQKAVQPATLPPQASITLSFLLLLLQVPKREEAFGSLQRGRRPGGRGARRAAPRPAGMQLLKTLHGSPAISPRKTRVFPKERFQLFVPTAYVVEVRPKNMMKSVFCIRRIFRKKSKSS